CSLDGVYFRYGLLVQPMSRLRLRPHGFIPDIAFGREPSNSSGGTFTRVDFSFPNARGGSAVPGEKDQFSSRLGLRTVRVQGHEGDSNVFTDVVHGAKALTQWVSLKRAIFELVLPFKDLVVSAPSTFHCRF
ncbi:MAG: hypothetical protein DVB28_001403, partial [Verrucomicrobia bacterium]